MTVSSEARVDLTHVLNETGELMRCAHVMRLLVKCYICNDERGQRVEEHTFYKLLM